MLTPCQFHLGYRCAVADWPDSLAGHLKVRTESHGVQTLLCGSVGGIGASYSDIILCMMFRASGAIIRDRGSDLPRAGGLQRQRP